MKKFNLELTYKHNHALSRIIGLMYYNGPPYSRGKSLSLNEMSVLRSYDDNLYHEQCNIYEQHPNWYKKFPFSKEENDIITHIPTSTHELDLLVIAMKETILDAEDDEDGYTLKVVTMYDLNTAREILEVLENYQKVMEQDNG